MSTPKQPRTLLDAFRDFDPETTAAYVRGIRWPDGEMCCPKCGSVKVGHIASRNRHQCKEKECRRSPPASASGRGRPTRPEEFP